MKKYSLKPPQICVYCKKEFRPLSRKARCCSPICTQRNHAEKNKEKIRLRRVKHYLENIEKERANSKSWYQKNRLSEIQKNREYRKEKKELFDWYHNKDRFDGLRDIVIGNFEGKCAVCETEEKLSVHHIDGKGYTKGNPNNDLKNLIVLCNSCHHKLHWWQRKNHILENQEDIVRTMRKRIEADGKSLR